MGKLPSFQSRLCFSSALSGMKLCSLVTSPFPPALLTHRKSPTGTPPDVASASSARALIWLAGISHAEVKRRVNLHVLSCLPSGPQPSRLLLVHYPGLYLDDIISLELPGTWTVSVFLGLNLRFDLLKRMCLTPSFLQDYLFYLLVHHSCLHRPQASLSQTQLGWISGALQSLFSRPLLSVP